MRVLAIGHIGDFKVSDAGYATASNGIYNCLKKMKEEKIIDDLDFASSNNMESLREVSEKTYDVALVNVNPTSFLNPQIIELYKIALQGVTKKYLHIVWETSPLPRRWEYLWKGNLFDGFFTPSLFLLNMIKENTAKPVFYLPHYIDTSMFTQLNIEKKIDEQKFTVLFFGQHTKRKGLEDAIISFVRSLGSFSDTQLILKYNVITDKEPPVDMLIHTLTKTNTTSWKSGIFTLTDMLSQEEIVKLYQNSSVLLFPTRGEGFGLPLIEAMSIGLPIISTGWSACDEVLKESKGNIKVEYTLDSSVCMSHFGYEYNSLYAIPKIKSLEDALRNKYLLWKSDKSKYYEETIDNRALVESRYNYEALKNYLLTIVV